MSNIKSRFNGDTRRLLASSAVVSTVLIWTFWPTLKGLWETAPYLHDGSAVTLVDVITTANLNDMHGHTSDLTDKQRQQLVDYLLQIDESEMVTTEETNSVPALKR